MYYSLPTYCPEHPADPFTPKESGAVKTTREQRMYVYQQRKKGKTYKELANKVNITTQGAINICKRVDRKIKWLKHAIKNEHKAAEKLNLNIWEYRKIYTQ